MGGSPFISKALSDSHKLLDRGNALQKEAGGPLHHAEPAASPSNYSHVREARKEPGSFMGIESDKGPELNTALASHEAAKKALE